jgi:hypothetical protein
MTAQLTLFDLRDPPQPITATEPPLSHRSDPITSFLAADQFARSGKLGRHHQLVLDGVRRCPGGTHMEISAGIPELDWIQTVRRLSELEHGGFVRKGPPKICTIKHSKCSTWWVTEVEAV